MKGGKRVRVATPRFCCKSCLWQQHCSCKPEEQHGALPSESLAELVVQRARQNPTAFAVVSPEGTFTFGEVLRRAELLATCLLEHAQPIYVDNRSRSASGASRSGSAEFGAVGSVAPWLGSIGGKRPTGPGHAPASAFPSPLLEELACHSSDVESGGTLGASDLVALMVGPGLWMIAGPLGAWMAGSGYFALDASHPLERILQMTEDAAPGCLVTEKRHQSLANSLGWPSVMVEDLKEFDLRQGRPDKSLE